MTDLALWLEHHNLARHHAVLVENDIDLDVLGELTEDDFKELGLSLGDRKRMLGAIRELNQTAPPGQAGAPVSPAASDPVTTMEAGGPPAEAANARRQVTVLFADLSGFTNLSTTMDAEEVHDLLQRYFSVVDVIIKGFGGTIDKHIGDAVMAVFGAPVAHTDDPERAVRAALEMHRRLAEFTPPLVAHVGIASGQVVASRTGSSSFDEYTMTGASVNLAARLQDLAGPGETLISDAVQNTVADIAVSELVGDVEVKGFAAPIKTWRVLNTERRTTDDNTRPFVGRRRELRQLRGVVSECLETKSGQLILLRGEPGIGKTSLVDRFQTEVIGEGFACHTALVLDFGAGKGRDAIPALVRSLIGIPPGSGKTIRRAAADKAIASGLLEAENAVHLNDLLDLPQPPALAASQDAMDHQSRMRGLASTVGGLARAAGNRGPVLLRIEDVHWADPLLLDRLAILAGAIAGATVVMLMTSRIEGDPIDAAWRAKVRDCPFTTIDLGPLSEADAAELAKQYLAANDALAQACIARAAGNPLFLDQLLRNAEENAEQGVPGSVQSIVQTRIDNLDPGDRRAIQAAAVLGQRFLAATVAAMIEDAGHDCAGLVTHQLIRREGDGFLFVHALVRDGVYGTLLGDDRRALHVRAADWFADHDLILHARHLEAAEHADARAAYIAASREQLAAYHYDHALSLAEAATGLANDSDGRVDALCLAGEILRLLGDAGLSIEHYQSALTEAASPAGRIRCRLGLAAGMRILDLFDDAFEQLDRAEALCHEAGIEDPLAEIEFTRGNLYFPLGRTEECLAAHNRAIIHARKAGNAELQIQVLGGLADASYASCRIESARRYFSECVDLARQAGFPRIEVANIPMVGWASLLSGDYIAGHRLLEEAHDITERAGNDRARIIVLNGLSMLASNQGATDRAEIHAREIIRLSERLSSGRFLSYGLTMLAVIELARDNGSAARRALERAIEVAEGPALRFCGPWIYGASASVADTRDEAHRFLDTGEAMLDAGAVAHNHFFFRFWALEYSLGVGDWERLEHHAAAFNAYLGPERTRYTDYFIERARALAAVRRGVADAATHQALRHCLAYAEEQGLAPSADAIRVALSTTPMD